jgi:hypothetical protein
MQGGVLSSAEENAHIFRIVIADPERAILRGEIATRQGRSVQSMRDRAFCAFSFSLQRTGPTRLFLLTSVSNQLFSFYVLHSTSRKFNS